MIDRQSTRPAGTTVYMLKVFRDHVSHEMAAGIIDSTHKTSQPTKDRMNERGVMVTYGTIYYKTIHPAQDFMCAKAYHTVTQYIPCLWMLVSDSICPNFVLNIPDFVIPATV